MVNGVANNLGETALAMSAQILIEDNVTWEILAPRSSDDSFVAICKQLGLSVQAKNLDGLMSRAQDALDSLTADLTAHNDAILFLTQHGIRFRVEPVHQSGGGWVLPIPAIRTESHYALPA